MHEIVFLFLAGLIGGFLAGFTGIGGGIIYIVVLPLAFENKGMEESSLAAIIVANSIFGIFVASLISVITHLRLKTIYLKESILVSVPAVIFSTLILVFYVNTSKYSYDNFNVFIILLMILVLVVFFIKNKKGDVVNKEESSTFKYLFSGSISGIVSALGGVGGAITLMPLLQHWQKTPIKKAKSLSLTMILAITGTLSIFNLLQQSINQEFIGLINFKMISPMIFGILISSSFGVNKSHQSSGKIIEVVFISFVILVLINKIYILIN